MIILGVILLVLAALFGMPLFVVVMSAAMLGFLSTDIDLSVIAIEVFRITDTPMLVALPLFTFAGYVLAESRSSERLVAITQALVGWMPSGLAIVGFMVCAVFTALTGASGVTIVAIGALLLPALKKSGYDEKFSLGLVTTSGSLGLLLAPSLPLILYGVIAQQSDVVEPFAIQDLFIAGLLPAGLMIGMLSLWTVYRHRGGVIPRISFTGEALVSAFKAARWELPLPFVILGGVYSGYFAISEAAAVTALYVTVVEVFVYREIAITKLPHIIRDAMIMIGGIILILGMALAFTNFLVDAEIPQQLLSFIQEHVKSAIAFLILLNILLLFLGAILDVFSAIVIIVPMLLPIAAGYGIHPVHLGIIFLANMQIGYFTPPIGMNLFIASSRFKKPVSELYSASWPFFLVLLAALILITYIPAISLVFLD